MKHDPATAHESAATTMNPSWGAILAASLVAVLVPIVGMVLVTHPMLGVGVFAGIVVRPVLRAGRRLGRRIRRHVDEDRGFRWRTSAEA